MTISLRTLLIAAIAVAIGLAGYVVLLRPDAAPATSAAGSAASSAAIASDPSPISAPAAPARDEPLGTVDGLDPGTKLTLLGLRRSGPKVVSARLRIDFEGTGNSSAWIPWDDDRNTLHAQDMRLVDEVNGREHFVLRNADGTCLCSGEFVVVQSGESSVISAKFPAPPADVKQVSIETPGFPSFDAVPLS
jgi:hypothetical protein